MRTTDRLMQALLIGLAAASFLLFLFRRPTRKGLALAFDASGLALVKGSLAQGERLAYFFQAYAGQELQASLSSSPGPALLQLLGPGLFGRPLPGAGPEDAAQSWRGVAPRTGTYQILIASASGAAEFTLRVVLTR